MILVIDKVNEFKNPTCVGLDPDISKIPNHIKQKNLDIYGNTRKAVGKCFVEFNKGIIDATKDVVGIYKPQMAFYESYGVEGIQAFIDTVQYLKSLNKIVIEDAKRNDIGNTALSYAKSHLGEIELINSTERIYDVDLITINGYLGSDGIKPFVEISNKFNKGAFVLAKTSNKSSVDIQDTISIYKNKNIKHYLMMMEFIKKWGEGTEGSNGYICLGAVIGTTFPKDAKIIRENFQNVFSLFLDMGYKVEKLKTLFPALMLMVQEQSLVHLGKFHLHIRILNIMKKSMV
ncbi:Orotidine 5'-phosphate decarboxylase subfamily 2 [Beggiatoa sp. PS]|nr:Orotidine 5'-phosphate decarboxylase subfamily 2 [Beggiatoa sp. PS]